MTTCNKIMWKREEIAPKEQFLLFSHIILYIFLTSGVKLHIHLLNVIVQFIEFLTLSTLICRGTDISKCFSESLGIRENESRLYMCQRIAFPLLRILLNENWASTWEKRPAKAQASLRISALARAYAIRRPVIETLTKRRTKKKPHAKTPNRGRTTHR